MKYLKSGNQTRVETMRPPACVQCKWGTGTTCEKPSNSVSAKEVADKLAQMKAEREKQDTFWAAPAPTTDSVKSTVEVKATSTTKK